MSWGHITRDINILEAPVFTSGTAISLRRHLVVTWSRHQRHHVSSRQGSLPALRHAVSPAWLGLNSNPWTGLVWLAGLNKFWWKSKWSPTGSADAYFLVLGGSDRKPTPLTPSTLHRPNTRLLVLRSRVYIHTKSRCQQETGGCLPVVVDFPPRCTGSDSSHGFWLFESFSTKRNLQLISNPT